MANVSALAESIEEYVRCAIEHGRATHDGDHQTANRAADRLQAIQEQVLRLGQEGESALAALTDNIDANVQCWAATHLLDVSPSRAQSVLQRLAEQRGFVAFAARHTLAGWRRRRN